MNHLYALPRNLPVEPSKNSWKYNNIKIICLE